MEWIRINEEGEVEFVTEECKLVPEVQTLLTLKYNKGKKDYDGRQRYRAKDEIKYLYLAYSSKSPYKDYTKAERIEEARNDCGFDNDWKESDELKQLIVRYERASPNKIVRLLKTTEAFVEKLEAHLNGIDLNERTPSGALLYKSTEVMATLERLPRLAETLFELENQAKVGVITKISSKGDHEVGWMAMNKMSKPKNDGENDSDTGD